MKIGSITLDNPTVMAPLAGITNLPFRLLVKEAGCALVCSEMISANGLVYGAKKTHALLNSDPKERPLAVQIFGSDPAIMAEAARIVAQRGADILDINFGCSVRKILKSGSGSALMRNPDTAGAVLKAVRAAITIPLTIKIRTGWDNSGDDAALIARVAQDCGINAIAMHPRTATQGFGGYADWRQIKALKQQLTIPVIGNGDITCAADAQRMMRETGCDAVMVGRAAIGNPLLFEAIIARLAGGSPPAVDLQKHFGLMRRYVADTVAYFGELHACRMLRSRLPWFVKGMRHSSRFRKDATRIETHAQATALIDRFAQLQAVAGL